MFFLLRTKMFWFFMTGFRSKWSMSVVTLVNRAVDEPVLHFICFQSFTFPKDMINIRQGSCSV